jgi:protocatechuate 3,4-dioxygenase beta subunit
VVDFLIVLPSPMIRKLFEERFLALALALTAAPVCGQEAQPAKREPNGKNRLEEIERIRKEFAPADPNRQYGPEDRITISGSIATGDGSPLPGNLFVGGLTRRNGYSGAVNGPVNAEGRFEMTVEFGRISLHLTAPGYAPALLSPLAAEPGGKIENVRIVLDRGFAGKIRLTGPQGEPVTGAKIQAMYAHGEGGSFAHVAAREVTTDKDGLALLENCADYPLTAETEVAGLQADRAELKLRPDAVTEWKLKTARPTIGLVVSRDDDAPIAGAEVRLVRRDGFHPRTYRPFDDFEKPPLLATTGEAGRFTLDTLRDDSRYTVLVSAPGRGAEIVTGISSGKDDLKIELGPPRFIQGVITGDLSRLSRGVQNAPQAPYFNYVNPLRLGDSVYSISKPVVVEIVDGRGHFQISNLLPGQVRLDLPGQATTLQVTEAIKDLEIALKPSPMTPASSPGNVPRRKVVLKLKTPEGEPPPRGELIVHCYPTRPPAIYERRVVPLAGNQVEFDAPVPCRLQWHPDNLIGYWIKMEQVEMAEAPTPFEKEIDALPAGAVYGQMLNEDGSPCPSFSLSVHTVSPAPEVQNAYLGNLSSFHQGGDGRFVIGPLPLGGVYRIEVQGQGERTNTRVASEDLTLTRAESVHRVELRMPEGITLAGRVVDPEGKPIPAVEVRLGRQTPNRSDEGAAQATDQDGRFEFAHVNAELPGTYYIHVQPQQQYRGQRSNWKPGSELTVQLRRGWRLEGQLIEHNTGRVIPGAVLYAQPAVFDRNFYVGRHEVRTDAAGRFRYETLEPIPYRFYASGVNAAQGAPPWEADPRAVSEIILSGDVAQGSDLLPVPPPPDEP